MTPADFEARGDAICRTRAAMREGIIGRANDCAECLRWRALRHPVQGAFCDDHHRELRECDRQGEDALAELRREEKLHDAYERGRRSALSLADELADAVDGGDEIRVHIALTAYRALDLLERLVVAVERIADRDVKPPNRLPPHERRESDETILARVRRAHAKADISRRPR
jgi:hypothetical protein